MSMTIRGKAYVVGDNIDTDQIIPAEYLALVPTIPEEYQRLGHHALCGLPREHYPTRLVAPGQQRSMYNIVIAGRNFGCGSSREHAPIALGAAGICAVVAESFARIFFRNCISTGEVYPLEAERRLCREISTGNTVEIDLTAGTLRHAPTGQLHALRPSGETTKIVACGGLFEYARRTGLVSTGGNAG